MLYRRRDRYKPEPLEIFNYTEQRQKEATVYVKSYKQGRDFYGEPWWLAAREAVEVCVQVPKYNRSQMDNGFAPVVHLHMETEKDEADIAKMYDNIKASYFGVTAEGLFLTFGRSGENVALNPLPRGDHAGELDEMYNNSEGIVVRTYLGSGGSILYGLGGKTGMDGADAALQQAVNQFQKTFVEPRQKLVTRELIRLMTLDGIKDVWDCTITPLDIIDAKVDEVQDRQAYMRAVTIDEHREARLNLEELPNGEGKALLIAAGAKPSESEGSEDKPDAKP